MKQKLLSILALLLIAVTGAWAQTTYNVTFSANGNTKTIENVSLPHTFSCDFRDEDGELDKIIQELYRLEEGFCGREIRVISGGLQVSAGTDGKNDYITINGPFDGTATVQGVYSDHYDDVIYTLTITTTEYTPPSYLHLENISDKTATLVYGPVPDGKAFFWSGPDGSSCWEGQSDDDDFLNFTHQSGTSITVDESCKEYAPEFLDYLFAVFTETTTINNIENINTSNATTLSLMFSLCESLTSLDLSSWDVSKVTSMSFMFNNCSNLETLNISGWDVSNVSNTNRMFNNCTKLTKSVTANEGESGEYWATFYDVPAGYNYQAPSGTQVFKVDLSGTSLTMTEITDGIVTSGKGVVLKSTSGSIALTPTIASSSDDYSGNSLQGTTSSITNPGNAYVLNYKAETGVGFYKLAASGTIGAGKAYLTYSGSSAREFFHFYDVTGIGEVQGTGFKAQGSDARWYTIDGKKLYGKPTAKGVYILNRKAVVIH